MNKELNHKTFSKHHFYSYLVLKIQQAKFKNTVIYISSFIKPSLHTYENDNNAYYTPLTMLIRTIDGIEMRLKAYKLFFQNFSASCCQQKCGISDRT